MCRPPLTAECPLLNSSQAIPCALRPHMVAYRPGRPGGAVFEDARAATEDAVTSPVIEERADIEAQTAGMTFCGLLQQTVAAYGDEPAYSDRDGGAPWQTLTWRQFRDQVLRLAAA